jgi:hypothetical protein
LTDEGVKKLIGKVATDDIFRDNFFKDPDKAIRVSGYAIDKYEARALAAIKPEDFSVDIERRVIGVDKSDVEVGVTAVKSFKGRPSEHIVRRPR